MHVHPSLPLSHLSSLPPPSPQSTYTQAKNAMQRGEPLIVIDNTNLQAWEMLPYVKEVRAKGHPPRPPIRRLSPPHLSFACRCPPNQGRKCDYRIELMEPDTSWRYDVEECARRNSHGVPQDKVPAAARLLRRPAAPPPAAPCTAAAHVSFPPPLQIQAMMQRFQRNITVSDLYRRATAGRREGIPRVGPAAARPKAGPSMSQTTLTRHFASPTASPAAKAANSDARSAFEREMQTLRRKQTQELEDYRREGNLGSTATFSHPAASLHLSPGPADMPPPHAPHSVCCSGTLAPAPVACRRPPASASSGRG